MNLDAINNQDPEDQLDSLFEVIDALEDEQANTPSFFDKLFNAVGTLHTYGANALYGFGISIDQEVPQEYLPTLSQGGLQLPDKSYYVAKYLTKYHQHIQTMFTLVGLDDVAERADRVVDLETQLALIAMDNAALRDPFATYNKYHVDQVHHMYPRLNLNSYFNAAGEYPFTTL